MLHSLPLFFSSFHTQIHVQRLPLSHTRLFSQETLVKLLYNIIRHEVLSIFSDIWKWVASQQIQSTYTALPKSLNRWESKARSSLHHYHHVRDAGSIEDQIWISCVVTRAVLPRACLVNRNVAPVNQQPKSIKVPHNIKQTRKKYKC